MTYNVFSGMLNPTHFTSLHVLCVILLVHRATCVTVTHMSRLSQLDSVCVHHALSLVMCCV